MCSLTSFVTKYDEVRLKPDSGGRASERFSQDAISTSLHFEIKRVTCHGPAISVNTEQPVNEADRWLF